MTASVESPALRVPDPPVRPPASRQKAYVVFLQMSISVASERVKAESELSVANQAEIQKIKEFASLEADWDSYDSAPISGRAIADAVDFVRRVDRYGLDVDFASPGPNGEVMVRLKHRQREAEVIFYHDRARFVCFEANEFRQQGEYERTHLPEMIDWLRSA